MFLFSSKSVLLRYLTQELNHIEDHGLTYSANYLQYLNDLRNALIRMNKKEVSLQTKYDLLSKLDVHISALDEEQKKQKREHDLEREFTDIKRGFYQHCLYSFTYYLPTDRRHNYLFDLKKQEVCLALSVPFNGLRYQDYVDYYLYPLLNEPGLRCTLAFRDKPQKQNLEIWINFYGEIDTNGLISLLEKGSPGEETVKKYAYTFETQLCYLLHQLSILYPKKQFHLILAGHSLGGALAMGLIHHLQKSIALQKDNPSLIMNKISKTMPEEMTQHRHFTKDFIVLYNELINHQKKHFHSLVFKKIEGLTLYALNAPGVSQKLNNQAILMSYFFSLDFLRIYHHREKNDELTQFGECQLFAPNKIYAPHLRVNKVFHFELPLVPLPKTEIKLAFLPFTPSMAKTSHVQSIYDINPINTTVIEPENAASFNPIPETKKLLYKSLFLMGGYCNKMVQMKNKPEFDFFKSSKACPIDLIPQELREHSALTIQKAFRKKKAIDDEIQYCDINF